MSKGCSKSSPEWNGASVRQGTEEFSLPARGNFHLDAVFPAIVDQGNDVV
jgi:hypothetical protein